MAKKTKYGEETVLLSIRVPLSKSDEISNRFYVMLNEYISGSTGNPFTEIESVADSETSLWKNSGVSKSINVMQEKKINPADNVIDIVAPKRVVDMDALRAIAGGKTQDSGMFVEKKKSIEEEYDFEYAKSVPDEDSRVSIGSKGLAFYDRYDGGLFYVKWEGKYLKFNSENEFNRFANDNLIK